MRERSSSVLRETFEMKLPIANVAKINAVFYYNTVGDSSVFFFFFVFVAFKSAHGASYRG